MRENVSEILNAKNPG